MEELKPCPLLRVDDGEERTCQVSYQEQIVDHGKFDVYHCMRCGEDFAMFGMVTPEFCPKCGASARLWSDYASLDMQPMVHTGKH